MQLCDGVLVVLDPGAVVFTRIWCCFEQATVVKGKALKLDFGTVANGKAELLTEGFAHENEADSIKAHRERGFPLELMEKGYQLDITKADASSPVGLALGEAGGAREVSVRYRYLKKGTSAKVKPGGGGGTGGLRITSPSLQTRARVNCTSSPSPSSSTLPIIPSRSSPPASPSPPP